MPTFYFARGTIFFHLILIQLMGRPHATSRYYYLIDTLGFCNLNSKENCTVFAQDFLLIDIFFIGVGLDCAGTSVGQTAKVAAE